MVLFHFYEISRTGKSIKTQVVSDCQGFGEKRLIVNMYRISFRGDKNVLKLNSGKMATHSSIPAWNSPWTEEPGGL